MKNEKRKFRQPKQKNASKSSPAFMTKLILLTAFGNSWHGLYTVIS